jgi:hypothetical protein
MEGGRGRGREKRGVLNEGGCSQGWENQISSQQLRHQYTLLSKRKGGNVILIPSTVYTLRARSFSSQIQSAIPIPPPSPLYLPSSLPSFPLPPFPTLLAATKNNSRATDSDKGSIPSSRNARSSA